MNLRISFVILALVSLTSLIGCKDKTTEKVTDVPEELSIYAGAGLRPALDEVINAFKEKTSIDVFADYGGSGIVLTRASLDKKADLFMPGDVGYVDRFDKKTNMVDSRAQVSWFVPVIITGKNNPLKIKSLADFFKPGTKVAVGDPKACQIGRLCSKKLFKKNGLDFSKLKEPKQSTTVNILGTWVATGESDVSVVWDATANNLGEKVFTVEIPKEKNVISSVVIAKLKTSKKPKLADKFIEFITSEEGKKILNDKGFRTTSP